MSAATLIPSTASLKCYSNLGGGSPTAMQAAASSSDPAIAWQQGVCASATFTCSGALAALAGTPCNGVADGTAVRLYGSGRDLLLFLQRVGAIMGNKPPYNLLPDLAWPSVSTLQSAYPPTSPYRQLINDLSACSSDLCNNVTADKCGFDNSKPISFKASFKNFPAAFIVNNRLTSEAASLYSQAFTDGLQSIPGGCTSCTVVVTGEVILGALSTASTSQRRTLLTEQEIYDLCELILEVKGLNDNVCALNDLPAWSETPDGSAKLANWLSKACKWMSSTSLGKTLKSASCECLALSLWIKYFGLPSDKTLGIVLGVVLGLVGGYNLFLCIAGYEQCAHRQKAARALQFGKNRWRVELNGDLCLYSFFCWPKAVSEQSKLLEEVKKHRAAMRGELYETPPPSRRDWLWLSYDFVCAYVTPFNTPPFSHSQTIITSLCNRNTVWDVRKEVAEKYNIGEDKVGVCCSHPNTYFEAQLCGPCLLGQSIEHMKLDLAEIQQENGHNTGFAKSPAVVVRLPQGSAIYLAP